MKHRKPIFFWQGSLILAPLLVLGAIGIVFLRHDQARAEEEARSRARELAQQLAAALPRAVPAQLNDFDSFGSGWFQYYRSQLAGWPAEKPDQESIRLQTWYATRLPRFSNDFGAFQWIDVWPVDASFDAPGKLVYPADYQTVPEPADWLSRVSTEQQRLWQEANQVNSGTNTAAIWSACFALMHTNIDKELNANAHWIATYLAAATNTLAQGKSEFLKLRVGHARTESGLPIEALAFAEALRRSKNLDAELYDGLQRQVFATPSIFTQRFLDQAQALAAQDTKLEQALEALRECWAAQQRLRRLAHLIQEAGILNDIMTTNVWLDTPDGRWFVILNSSPEIHDPSSTNGLTAIRTNRTTNARFYPKRIVGSAFQRAIADSKLAVPAYLAIEVQLAGEVISPHQVTMSHQSVTLARIFAEEDGTLTSPGIWGGATKTDQLPGQEYEELPSHPAFKVRLILADAALFRSQQRDRTLWIALLIFGSAIAALTGLIATHRAFHRQHRLAEMKSNFVSSVSHELRAPIASVRLMAEGLERGKVPEPARQHEYFRFIVQECRRLSAMIENVLDFARIEQDRKQYDLEPTDVPALVQQTVKLMTPYAAERGVRLMSNVESRTPNASSVATDGRSLVLNLDGQAIQQALVNLIDNAVKHSPTGNEVLVELAMTPLNQSSNQDPPSRNHDPVALRISVTDHGPGIPASEHQKIFERFYRLGSELRRETPGVGIGLSIVKHVVEAHGGRVHVVSAPAKGSTFIIELPTAKGDL